MWRSVEVETRLADVVVVSNDWLAERIPTISDEVARNWLTTVYESRQGRERELLREGVAIGQERISKLPVSQLSGWQGSVRPKIRVGGLAGDWYEVGRVREYTRGSFVQILAARRNGLNVALLRELMIEVIKPGYGNGAGAIKYEKREPDRFDLVCIEAVLVGALIMLHRFDYPATRTSIHRTLLLGRGVMMDDYRSRGSHVTPAPQPMALTRLV